MAEPILQNKVNLFIMPEGLDAGKGTGLQPMSIDKHSMTGKSNATIPGRGQDYGYDVYGRIRVKNTFQEAPGGLFTATIEFDKTVDIEFLEERERDQAEFGIWEQSSPCGRRDNPFAWIDGGRLDFHGKMTISGFNGGDAPARDGTAAPVVGSADVTWEYDIKLRPLSIDSVGPAIATNQENVLGIFGIKEPKVPGCAPGYQGPDEHLWIISAADTASDAEIHFSEDGGSIWTQMTNQPFGTGEDIADGAVMMLAGSEARVVVGNGTGTTALQIAYADIEFGNVAAATWTVVGLNAVAADYVSRVGWLWYNGLYIAGGTSGDDLWLSTDQGETFTQVVVGSGDQINAIAKGYGQDCEDVYIAGANNLIMVDRGRSGTFAALVGPSGGGAFTALAINNDGDLFAGNGQSLFVSTNKGLNAGGWTSLKDFGSNKVVVDIFFPMGDSNHIYVVVDDTAPGAGVLWHSNDHGNSFRAVATLTNGGYNRGYKSEEDDNLYYMVGDVQGSYGVAHRATPTTLGC